MSRETNDSDPMGWDAEFWSFVDELCEDQRKLLDELGDLVATGVVSKERTDDALKGELSCIELESDPMANEMPTTIRVPEETLEKANELADRISENPTIKALFGGRASRSAVLRLALQRGLEDLDAELPKAKKRRKASK